MKLDNYQMGDIVRVTNTGQQYSTFDEMARIMNLTNWRKPKSSLNNGDIGEIIANNIHPNSHEKIYGIKVNNHDFIIGIKGIELLDKDWYIQITRDNYELCKEWYNKNKEHSKYDADFHIGYMLMDNHIDGSCFWACSDENEFRRQYSKYHKITTKQLKRIMSANTPLNDKTPIIIGRDILNTYYEAANQEQRMFINDNFKISGQTTVKAIRKLRDMACSKWKSIIENNHPNCFVNEKHFSNDQLIDIKHNSIGIFDKGFQLDSTFNWEFNPETLMLIPSKK